MTRANYGMLSGAFELSFDDGDIRFRTNLRLPDVPDDTLRQNGLLTGLMKEMVYINVQMMDQYLPGIHGVIQNVVPPAQAITQIEG